MEERRKVSASGELVRFCAVGASGVLVNMGLLYLLTRGVRLPVEVASPLAIEAAIVSNFFLNERFTFAHRAAAGAARARLLRFHVVAAIAALVNYAVLLGLVRGMRVHDLVANLFGIAAGTFVNFTANSLWTWRRTAAPAP